MTAAAPSRVVVALDYPDAAPALAFVARIDPSRCALKVGKELFVAAGPDLVRALVARGYRVFVDLKFHDIPNTVAGACAAVTGQGAWMLNVHASGGLAMMAAARAAVDRAAAEAGRTAPLLIAVTVLTSLTAADLVRIGVGADPQAHALLLARLARDAGLDGVVCSAREAPEIRRECGPSFQLVTPGIRPAGEPTQDQARVTTPEQAVAAGADWLVIGRPITGAADPVAALDAINAAVAATAGHRENA